MTYIPKQTKLTRERLEAKLETGLIEKLERYCEYLDSDRDYVVTQALEIAFKKDKGFAEWLQRREENTPANTAVADATGRGRNGGKRGSESTTRGITVHPGPSTAAEPGVGSTQR